ncbi:MAG: acetylxylan esterase [Verrucomicrobia bacterium]|nr:acetylxylan esterase [Verrucomicrobiota bacterium]
MRNHLLRFALVLLALSKASDAGLSAQSLPEHDLRATKPKTLNTLRTFPNVTSKSAWQARAKEIRDHVLVSCGLWPMPEKTPLNAQVFGKVLRDGYSIEKVALQTYPGFYLAGNLYRPIGKGNGPFPAILNPHGHWSNGRMADEENGSIAARCINFARQGMIAFSYDMVGYNDTIQVKHNFASNPTNLLWNISLMGLQTWNSIRALDFLASLPDADKSRLACTGESGGGTQTFMLGAIDDRLTVQAPIVMVSHSMQGGCLCENAPGLRVEYSNMEIAAVPAPRPQLLVAASGDWTKDTPAVEGPAIERVYRLFDRADRFRHVRFDFPHNYNRTSREAVYEWFGRWLLRHPEPASLKEIAYQKEPDQELRVWPDGKLPDDALDETSLIKSLIKSSQAQLETIKPTNARSQKQYHELMWPAWRHTLQAEIPERSLVVEAGQAKKIAGRTVTEFSLGRAGKGDRLSALMINPSNDSHRLFVVLAHPKGKAGYLDSAGEPIGLAKRFLDRGQSILLADLFQTGGLANADIEKDRKPFANYFSTYNRTDLQERVQDLITAAAFAKTHSKGRRVVLCGAGRAGLWSLLAAPAVDAVVADCDSLDMADDQALLAHDLFVPGIRKIGAFEGVLALAAPRSVLLHNTGSKFLTPSLPDLYQRLDASQQFRREPAVLSDDAIADWVGQLGFR